MSAKQVVPREKARQDVEAAVDYYAAEAGEMIALRFVDAIEETYRAIGRRPALGSPRYGHELDLPGLRTRSLKRFPYVVFYIEQEDYLDVWRVLHAHRDIPAGLSEPQG
ncbi:type II toxin-antitoxin system RelE/ParE family toxin [Phenylobacterium sp.]|uniref:type II toxin-antitoxin system RelE/ParE family toxin n=1 Tax=Phenylobacterium sp. TaxID=1871053 RepID=UPI00272458B1|nr:type II toxin-antitoxin system RelE/ParE family toxin [Phenylobacterium sp.]MDO8377922.1 type II toxin-antitoxin system RelE/ParE family toxin [Phenylobacterium sp.]